MRFDLFVLAVFVAIGGRGIADEVAELPKGAKVMPKLDAVVVVGCQTMDYTKFSSPWIVHRTWRNWLCVGNERKGWVLRSHVLTLDEAPAYYTKEINLGHDEAYKLRAVARLERGELDSAIADYGTVLQSGPDAVAFHNRGNVWKAKKEYDKAIADYDEAIRLKPGAGLPYSSRGTAWYLKRQFVKALADYDQAMRLDPGRRIAYNGAAWIRATCSDGRFRDGALATALATKACQLTAWTDHEDLDTLAAACAESGDFVLAVQYEQHAIELNPNDALFVKTAKERLAIYENHRAYRDE